MKKTKVHLLWFLIGIFIFGVLSVALDIGDDSECPNGSMPLTNGSNIWICNQIHYAQGWFHNVTNPLIINIPSASVYYNVTGFVFDNYNGISIQSNSIQITKSGIYRIIGTASWYGGNSGKYEWSLFINNEEEPSCAWHRSTSSTAVGDATMSCIIPLNKNDLLNIRVEDRNNPAQDVTIEALNFNIAEI